MASNDWPLVGGGALEEEVERFFADFGYFSLPFDSSAATRDPAVIIDRESAELAADRLDAQIAAICLATYAPLATRNTREFRRCGIELIDPWKAISARYCRGRRWGAVGFGHERWDSRVDRCRTGRRAAAGT